MEAEAFPLDAWTEGMFLEEMDRLDGFFLVEEVEGRVAGFLVGRILVDECHILDVVVDRAFRGQGVGRRLVEEAALRAPRLGATLCLLEVAEGNQGALHLYLSCGYVPVGRRAGYYRTGEAAVILTRQLVPSL